MLIPLEVLDFEFCTIGYFQWIVRNKSIRVVRIVGKTKDGHCIDWLFKPNRKISTAVNKILTQTEK